MARRASSGNKDVKTKGTNKGPRTAAKAGQTRGSRRTVQRESSSVGLINGRSEVHAEDPGHLHQLIAERAYLLYERSGFQHGKDLEHWLEAERQIKGE